MIRWLQTEPPDQITQLYKMKAINSSETSVHTSSARRHIPEDGILHSQHLENLKSYTGNYCFRILSSGELTSRIFVVTWRGGG
jgi:hypothetical protein